jgi:hypothetical protein
MRHAEARITLEHYAHVVDESQRQAVERVGEMLRPDSPSFWNFDAKHRKRRSRA